MRQILQSVTEIYYEVRQVLITKREGLLLQNASGIIKCDSHYKVTRNRGFRNEILA